MKILVTCFKPFLVLDRIFGNPSQRAGERLSKEFTQTDLLIMDVNSDCLLQLREKLMENYDFIFMLGEGDGFRIETKTSKGERSLFAEEIKRRIDITKKEDIGTYFCDRVYSYALKLNKNTIFIHLPLFYNYLRLKKIFMECITWDL